MDRGKVKKGEWRTETGWENGGRWMAEGVRKGKWKPEDGKQETGWENGGRWMADGGRGEKGIMEDGNTRILIPKLNETNIPMSVIRSNNNRKKSLKLLHISMRLLESLRYVAMTYGKLSTKYTNEMG